MHSMRNPKNVPARKLRASMTTAEEAYEIRQLKPHWNGRFANLQTIDLGRVLWVLLSLCPILSSNLEPIVPQPPNSQNRRSDEHEERTFPDASCRDPSP